MRRSARAAFVAVLLATVPVVAARANDVAAGPLPIDTFARLERGMGEQQVLAAVGLPTAEGTYRPRLDRVLGVIGLFAFGSTGYSSTATDVHLAGGTTLYGAT